MTPVAPIVALLPPAPLTERPEFEFPSTSIPGVPSFLIPRNADVRPREDGPPVADPLIDMADDSP
jgi:hypothetical protein